MLDEHTFQENWAIFTDELETEIFPLYKSHESRFDFVGIHGCMHISRAVIFAEWMSRYYMDHFNEPLDVAAVRYATAFHDSGREGNGPDLWEGRQQQKVLRILNGERFYYQFCRKKRTADFEIWGLVS